MGAICEMQKRSGLTPAWILGLLHSSRRKRKMEVSGCFFFSKKKTSLKEISSSSASGMLSQARGAACHCRRAQPCKDTAVPLLETTAHLSDTNSVSGARLFPEPCCSSLLPSLPSGEHDSQPHSQGIWCSGKDFPAASWDGMQEQMGRSGWPLGWCGPLSVHRAQVSLASVGQTPWYQI